MPSRHLLRIIPCITALVIGLVPPQCGVAESTSKPEEIVARHLESIGPTTARSGVKTRLAQGTAEFKILVGGAGTLAGRTAFVSDGHKLHFMMKFSDNNYRGERFVFDGSKATIASATAQQSRSQFGEFVHVQDAMLREGLWGGVLSTAWPLLELERRKPKLTFEGTKSLDGHQVYDLRYQPHKRTDLDIHLYFDAESFRLVRTVYSMSMRPTVAQGGMTSPLGGGMSRASEGSAVPSAEPVSGEVMTARQNETRYRLEERFNDYRSADGLSLPEHYNIHFVQELQNGGTIEWEWDLHETEVTNNISLDPRNFAIK